MSDKLQPMSPGVSNRPRHVLFFAAVPPPEVKSHMATAWQILGTGEALRHATLHLTICPVAGVDHPDPVLVTRARKAASAVRTAPFTLSFDRIMKFNGRPASRPLVITTEMTSRELNEIAAELCAACRALGITASRSAKITPHVTLAYGTSHLEPRGLEKPILWTIDEITLIDSLQGQGRHEWLGRWPLPRDRQQLGFDF